MHHRSKQRSNTRRSKQRSNTRRPKQRSNTRRPKQRSTQRLSRRYRAGSDPILVWVASELLSGHIPCTIYHCVHNEYYPDTITHASRLYPGRLKFQNNVKPNWWSVHNFVYIKFDSTRPDEVGVISKDDGTYAKLPITAWGIIQMEQLTTAANVPFFTVLSGMFISTLRTPPTGAVVSLKHILSDYENKTELCFSNNGRALYYGTQVDYTYGGFAMNTAFRAEEDFDHLLLIPLDDTNYLVLEARCLHQQHAEHVENWLETHVFGKYSVDGEGMVLQERNVSKEHSLAQMAHSMQIRSERPPMELDPDEDDLWQCRFCDDAGSFFYPIVVSVVASFASQISPGRPTRTAALKERHLLKVRRRLHLE